MPIVLDAAASAIGFGQPDAARTAPDRKAQDDAGPEVGTTQRAEQTGGGGKKQAVSTVEKSG